MESFIQTFFGFFFPIEEKSSKYTCRRFWFSGEVILILACFQNNFFLLVKRRGFFHRVPVKVTFHVKMKITFE